MKLRTAVLSVVAIIGVVMFVIENWSPTLPLIILGTPTIALPLAVWLMVACFCGVLTTLAIAVCLNVLVRSARPTVSTESFGSFQPPFGRPPSDSPKGVRSNDSRSSGDRPDDNHPNTNRRNNRRVRNTVAQSASSAQQPTNIDEWEDFSRPRQDWEDWQRRVPSTQSNSEKGNPVVTEVAFETPMNSGSRFTSPSPEVSQPHRAEDYERDRDAEVYGPEYDRNSQDAYGRYERDVYEQDAYEQDAYEQDAYEQDAYEQNYERGAYGQDAYGQGYEPYGQSTYGQSTYEQSTYEQNAYEQDAYERGDEPYEPNSYGQNFDEPGFPRGDEGKDYDRPSWETRYNRQAWGDRDDAEEAGSSSYRSASPDMTINQEQFILDYGDEAALDAFDTQLEQNRANKRQTEDIDLSDLEDWDDWDDDSPQPPANVDSQDSSSQPHRPIQEVQQRPTTTQQSGSVYSYSYLDPEQPASRVTDNHHVPDPQAKDDGPSI